MSEWEIIWFDGVNMRRTVVGPTDAYNVVSLAAGNGVNTWAIIEIKRLVV